MNQPSPAKNNTFKSALIGTAVAVPISIAAFYVGFSNNPFVNPNPNASQNQSIIVTNKNETTVDLKIKGNKNSMIYHLPRCASYDRIAEHNVIWFKTKEEAESAGYRMAKNC